ncbi:MAG TPA: CYTH domain-containing protein [Chondromyces sp.]|nr:CYTH domain-containing protein [Chondromyces sp.]
MSTELEIEFKNLLTKEEFDRLLEEFNVKKDQFILQHNHYFDTALFQLKEEGCALRIREKAGRYELTLKQPVEEGLLETNQHLTEEEAMQLLEKGIFPNGTVKETLSLLLDKQPNVQHFGTLSTHRAELSYEGGLLVLDCSSYFDCTDYELEYEVKERKSGEKIFLALLETYEIPLRKTDNKIKRFFKEKIRQSSGDK